MPVNAHLTFTEITDFAPGLITASDWLMPANGSQTMTGCHPAVGGGLNACFRGVPIDLKLSASTTIPSTYRVIGLFARGGLDPVVGPATGVEKPDYYMAAYDPTERRVYIYRLLRDQSYWELVKQHAQLLFDQYQASVDINPVLFDSYTETTTGLSHVIWTTDAAGPNEDGLWSVGVFTGDGPVWRKAYSRLSALAVQDTYIILAYGSTIVWADKFDGWSLAQSITLQASRQGTRIRSITPLPPGDLLIGTHFAPWMLLQGGLSDPYLRQMSGARALLWSQQPATTTQGMAFISPAVGVVLTSNGEGFVDVSTQLDPATWASNNAEGVGGGGVAAFAGHFLIAPGGHVWDQRTKSWFRTNELSGAAGHFQSTTDMAAQTCLTATNDPLALYLYGAVDSHPTSTYTWKSAPMRAPGGRRLRIREVQLVCRAYTTGDNFTITVNGTQRASGALTTGRQIVSFLFNESDEVLDIQVVANAAGVGEAPSIEAVRVGSASTNQAR